MKRLFRDPLFFVFVALAVLATGCVRTDPDAGQREEEKELNENPRLKAAVKAMVEDAATSFKTMNAVAVWQEGEYDPSGAWLNGTKRGTKHQMWSVSKTFTGMAVGIAAGEGKLSLSEKVAPMFEVEIAAAEVAIQESETLSVNEKEERIANLREAMKKLTVEDLLTMRCGHRHDPTVDYARAYGVKLGINLPKYIDTDGETIDVTKALDKYGKTMAGLFFEYPFEREPGVYFKYNTLATYILSEIITKKTGETLADYLDSRLFQPLGLDSPDWDEVQGKSAGGWGLHLTTDEMLAFGRLLLAGGKWNGRQIIPADYLKLATEDRVTDRSASCYIGYPFETTGYGYQTWTCSDGSLYRAVGLFGQYIIMLPKKKAVIAITSEMPGVSSLMSSFGTESPRVPLELAWKYIVPEL